MSATAVVSPAQPIEGVPDGQAIRLGGALTHTEAPATRRELLAAVKKAEAGKLVVELGGVESMDTSGAAVLAEVIKRALERDLPVLLCSPSESVIKVFRLAGFADVLSRCCADPTETRQRLLA